MQNKNGSDPLMFIQTVMIPPKEVPNQKIYDSRNKKKIEIDLLPKVVKKADLADSNINELNDKRIVNQDLFNRIDRIINCNQKELQVECEIYLTTNSIIGYPKYRDDEKLIIVCDGLEKQMNLNKINDVFITKVSSNLFM